MTVHRYSPTFRPAARGFSLIEVLLAVIVLSVGLLALAALQSSLIRSSAEAKDQSVAVAMAQETLESYKAFVNGAAYTAIDAPATAATSTVGATTFTVTEDVSRYVWRYDSSTSAGEFVDVGAANVTAADATIVALGSGTQSYFPGVEFKRVDVAVGWTDATGATREVELLGTISATVPAASAQVMGDLATARKDPEVRIYDPENDVGVIPIAVGTDAEGNDQSVASSDPKPEQYGSTGRVSTKFNVLTYYEDAAGFVVQKNIETALVSCSCTSSASGSDRTPNEGPFSPSYWDGDQFTEPKPMVAKTRGHLNTAIDQDQTLCGLCCRDHRDSTVDPDPTDDITRLAKFDPFRPVADTNAGDHRHYRNLSRLQQPLAADFTRRQDAGGFYDEACRLVRVDGLFRVTTDPRLENLSLLNMTRVAGVPTLSDSAKTNYQGFVTNYVGAAWSGLDAGTPHAELPDYTASAPDLAQTDPVTLLGAQVHNLHGRGLLIDWISQEAEAKLDCIGDTTTPVCQEELSPYRDLSILQVFPFLTVNMTNIGEWSRTLNTPTSGTDPVVSYRNDAIPNDRDNVFVRGEVTALEVGSAQVSVFSHRGPTGLTDQVPIDPEDAGVDADAFERATNDCIEGVDAATARSSAFCARRNYTVTTAGAGVPFKVRISDLTGDPNFPAGQFDVSAQDLPCTRGDGSAGSDPTNVHACSVAPETTTTATLMFSNYNRVIIDCGGGGWVPDDEYDPATSCVKKNQSPRAPNLVTVRDYKLCSLTTTATGVTFGTPADVRSPSNHPHTEVSSVSATFTPDAESLATAVVVATWVEQADACP